MASERLYYLVEWEHDENTTQSYCVINSSRIVQPSGEIHTGKLVTVTHNGAMRRAKVLDISDNFEKLQQNLLNLEETNISTTIDMNNSSMPPLDVTIQRLKQMLFKRNSEGNLVGNRSSSGSSYNNDDSDDSNMNLRPSTSRKSQDMVATKAKIRKVQKLDENSVSPNASNPMISQSLINEYSQLHQDLYKVQMQYLEIKHYVDMLSDKADAIATRINQWQAASGYDFNDAPINITHRDTSDEDEEGTPAKVPKVMPNGRRVLDDNEEDSEDENDMVTIGSGKTKVPRYVLNQIDWRSHTIATRKLLMAIFPRKVLATHSLTGKSSPAFTNKPAKLCLDTAKVRDIVITVSEKCNVNPSLVRGAITTKCADENKMYRVREAKKMNKKKKTGNQENVPPQSDLDESQNETQSPEM